MVFYKAPVLLQTTEGFVQVEPDSYFREPGRAAECSKRGARHMP